MSEEGIWPALMIGSAATGAGAFFLLSQERAQTSSNKAVENGEQGWRGMFEILEPAPQRRVEVGDDPREAVAPAAARPSAGLLMQTATGQ